MCLPMLLNGVYLLKWSLRIGLYTYASMCVKKKIITLAFIYWNMHECKWVTAEEVFISELQLNDFVHKSF